MTSDGNNSVTISNTTFAEQRNGTNAAVVRQPIRIQVLDCHTGEPVKNALVESIKIDAQEYNTLYRDFYEADSKKFPIYKVGQDWYHGTEKIKLKEPITDERKKNAAVQQALQNLGYYKGGINGDSDILSKAAYGQHWVSDLKDKERSSQEDYIIDDNNSRCYPFSDEQGIVRIYVPYKYYEKDFTLSIRFENFAVVREALRREIDPVTKSEPGKNGDGIIHREGKDIKPTGFSVEWTGPQDKDNWGWRLGPTVSEKDDQRKEFAEFKLTASFPIPSWATLKTKTFKAMQDKFKCFSMHYDSAKDPEFVVFAMRWCPPVWYDVEDKYICGEAQGKSKTLLVCTTFNHTERSKFFGEFGDIGRLRWHKGIDLAGKKGHPIFALCSGTLYHTQDQGAVGKGIYITPFEYAKSKKCQMVHTYSHLSEMCVSGVGTAIRSGQIIGKMGRTGTKHEKSSPTHLHFHFHINGWDKESGTGFSENDLQNWKKFLDNPTDPSKCLLTVFPHNNLLKVLPCRQTFGNAENNLNEADSSCNTGNLNKAHKCWAFAELVCPGMKPVEYNQITYDGKENRFNKIIQSQLKWFECADPGAIDGKIPVAQFDESGKFVPFNQDKGTRAAIKKFKEYYTNKTLAANETGSYRLNMDDLKKLNELAPIRPA